MLTASSTAKKSDVTHLKKQDFASDVPFNDPYDADLFCCIFMSAFVDDVIRDL